jgi:exosortase/archaeosortase family protein
MPPESKNILKLSLFLGTSLLFLVGIGFRLYSLESRGRIYLGILFIPFLLILMFIGIDHYLNVISWQKHRKLLKLRIQNKIDNIFRRNLWRKYRIKNFNDVMFNPLPLEVNFGNKPFRKKTYQFSIWRLILYPVGTTVLVLVLLHFVKTTDVVWWQELFSRHQVFLVNNIFSVDVSTIYKPENSAPWYTDTTEGLGVHINNGCVGLQAMSIFCSIILFAPLPSQESTTRGSFVWRKSTAIAASLILIYGFNVIRASIQFYLYYLGHAWSVVHDSTGMLAITVSVHVLIFLICLALMPEILISIFYLGKLLFKTSNERIIF